MHEPLAKIMNHVLLKEYFSRSLLNIPFEWLYKTMKKKHIIDSKCFETIAHFTVIAFLVYAIVVCILSVFVVGNQK